jgi:hypothetical protein
MLGRDINRGQVGSTTTWIVATLIIVFILLIFVAVSSIVAKAKDVESFGKDLFIDEESGEKIDWISRKTKFAFGIDSSNRDQINEWIENGP